MIEGHSHMSMPTLYTTMAVGMVFCAAEAVLSKFAELYFKNELADGNPFTLRGAKELMRLGILTIAIPLGTVIVSSIGVSIADNFFLEIEKLSYDGYSSVGLGIMMIVSSLLCRYGAEMRSETVSLTACGRQMAKDAVEPAPDTGLVSEGGAAGAVGEEPDITDAEKSSGFTVDDPVH